MKMENTNKIQKPVCNIPFCESCGQLRLSIIVPVYNVEQYLSKCLNSLLNQDMIVEDYEIIVINDGSTDNSLIILDEYAQRYKNIKIITQENQGLSGARNTGVNHAMGKYLFFVDSDDYIEPNCLFNLLQFAEKNDLDAIRFNYRQAYEDGKVGRIENLTLQNEKIKTGKEFLTDDLGLWCYVWVYLFKTDIVKQQKLFEVGIYFEDGEWTPRVLLQINSIGYLDKLVYNYLQRTGSITLITDITKKEKQISDKLRIIDCVLGLRNRYEDDSITLWSKKILSLSAMSLLNMVIHNFYPQRKYYINELKRRGLFPLSFYSTKKMKYIVKVMLLNISPMLYCRIVKRSDYEK